MQVSKNRLREWNDIFSKLMVIIELVSFSMFKVTSALKIFILKKEKLAP